MARKLAASLSYRVATRRKCFSLEKNRSMRLRSRYSRLLKQGFHLRLLLGGMLVGPGSAFTDEGAQGVGVVTLVGQQHRARSEVVRQLCGSGDVAGLARRQLKLDRAPLRVDEGVNLRGEPASRATETTISTPLFPVAPCWWTRTIEVSIIWTSPS